MDCRTFRSSKELLLPTLRELRMWIWPGPILDCTTDTGRTMSERVVRFMTSLQSLESLLLHVTVYSPEDHPPETRHCLFFQRIATRTYSNGVPIDTAPYHSFLPRLKRFTLVEETNPAISTLLEFLSDRKTSLEEVFIRRVHHEVLYPPYGEDRFRRAVEQSLGVPQGPDGALRKLVVQDQYTGSARIDEIPSEEHRG
jgi:hypothetical protein